jgi:RTX calcium-binding nonapeptide repeat (4 copies)
MRHKTSSTNPIGVLRGAVLGAAAIAALMAGGVADAAAAPAPSTCDGRVATIVGTDGPDRIVGTSGPDVISAGPGDDLVNAGGGADVICGSTGDDRLRGENGADRILGGDGNDDCSTSSADTISGCQSGSRTRFMPTRHGFPFANRFTVSRTIDYGVGSYNLNTAYGLCGGMVFAALDTFLVDDVAPGTATTPTSGLTYSYIRDRLVDSLTVGFGSNLAKFALLQPKSSTQLRQVTASTAIEVRDALRANGNRPLPLGVIFAQPGEPITDNHQVLVIGYFKRANGPRTLMIYDPNRPDQISYVDTEARRITDQDGSNAEPFRGVFVEKYERRTAPWS